METRELHVVDAALKADGVPVLLSKRRVAALLGVSPRTIDRYIARKQLRVQHGGGRVLILRGDLARFITGDRW